MHTKQKGDLTELHCISAFVERGFLVSIPYGENSRYDFIADINGKLIRIQAKTAHEYKNDPAVIEFSCKSTQVNSRRTKIKKYTKEDIDYFATYWNNQCYIVPIEECSTSKKLRFGSPKNNQAKNINFAIDYELDTQINRLLQEEVAINDNKK